MTITIDLTEGAEAFGEETTYFGGRVTVGETTRIIDGMTDRDGDYAWLGFVIDQLEIQLGILGDTEKYVEQFGDELHLGNKYEASLVDGELVITEIIPPAKKQYVFVFENSEPALTIDGFSTKTSFAVDAPDFKTAVAALAAWAHATIDGSEHPDNYTDDIDNGDISVYTPAKKED